ncbi:hypothetical protein [Photobacterium sp.]|uniref:hypothetical protein n=1 Tax=Photobacterium sp. TaxID=660 RepID=UPI00299CF5C9|nr:hypothetical protein [Photobacterium sp.]MDX1302239.1 hypothetical protein [Photobacterium sp.]
MRNITDFIEQLEREKIPFSIWVYSSNGHYSQFGTQVSKPCTSQLQETIDQRLQIIVKMHNDGAFLLLPEVHMVVPVNFHDGQIFSINMIQAA